ncbi:MAG: SAF domain-containing protein [Micrococcales bacterium]|nr:SAF domain-containing protein [Micrococcales bacterium]
MADLRPAPLPLVRTGWRAQVRVWAWRFRFPVAAALVGLAVLSALDGLRPAPAGSVRVVVTAHDVTAGQTLARGDLRYATVPGAAAPEGAAVGLDDIAGRTVVADLPAGVPLAAALLGATPHGPAGTVVATVRLADPQMVALLSPGDRVDVLAAPLEGGTGSVVARGATVLPAPATSPTDDGLFGGCGPEPTTTVVLAVSPEEMPGLSGAAGSTLSAFVVR